MASTNSRQARRALHTGSRVWREIRQRVLTEEMYVCRACGGFGDQVDHIDGDSHNNARANLQVLCHRDHSAKTAREIHGLSQRLGCAEDGVPKDPRHHWNST